MSFSLSLPTNFPGIFSTQSIIYSLATAAFVGVIGYITFALTGTGALLLGNTAEFLAAVLLG